MTGSLLTPPPSPSPFLFGPYPRLWGIDWPTSISIALALTAVLLAAIGIFLIVASGIAYLNFRDAAEKQAEKTAKSVAAEVAERVGRETAKVTAVLMARETSDNYLSTNLPSIVAEYVRLMTEQSGASNAQADAIAEEEGARQPNEDDQTDQGNS